MDPDKTPAQKDIHGQKKKEEDKKKKDEQKPKVDPADKRSVKEAISDIINDKEKKDVKEGKKENKWGYGWMEATDYLHNYADGHNLGNKIDTELKEKKERKRAKRAKSVLAHFRELKNWLSGGGNGEVA